MRFEEKTRLYSNLECNFRIQIICPQCCSTYCPHISNNVMSLFLQQIMSTYFQPLFHLFHYMLTCIILSLMLSNTIRSHSGPLLLERGLTFRLQQWKTKGFIIGVCRQQSSAVLFVPSLDSFRLNMLNELVPASDLYRRYTCLREF